MTYDWMAGLAFLVLLIAMTKLAKFLVFKIPVLQQMKAENRELDYPKKKMAKYPPIIKQNNQVGLGLNILLFVAVAPWVVTLNSQYLWKIGIDILLIVLIYDFFYYLMHRFLFHGEGYFRRVHALHHQARNPTLVDSFYVHPLETALGIVVFILSFAAPLFITGPVHIIAAVIAYMIWGQINTIIHTYFNVNHFPFKTINWMVAVHHVHHENMHRGNFSSITLLFDKLFGTLEGPAASDNK